MIKKCYNESRIGRTDSSFGFDVKISDLNNTLKNNDIMTKEKEKVEEKNIRNLKNQVINFVNTWHEVVELKVAEYEEDDPEEKIAKKKANEKRANENLKNPFGYIYNWLSLDEHGKFKSHSAKRTTTAGKKPRERCNVYPIGADISDYFCDNMPASYNDEASVVGSVNRILKEIRNVEIELEQDGTYRPMTLEYRRTKIMPRLAEYSAIDDRKFFAVSINTYIIYYSTSKLEKEIDFFKEFIGEKALFDISIYDNKLVILIAGKSAECRKIGELLRTAVKRAYAVQEEKRKGTKKGQEKKSLVKKE